MAQHLCVYRNLDKKTAMKLAEKLRNPPYGWDSYVRKSGKTYKVFIKYVGGFPAVKRHPYYFSKGKWHTTILKRHFSSPVESEVRNLIKGVGLVPYRSKK